MALKVLRPTIVVNSMPVEGISTGLTLPLSRDAVEVTVLGDTWRTFQPGLMQGEFTLSGYLPQDSAALRADFEEVRQALRAGQTRWVLILPDGRGNESGTESTTAYAFRLQGTGLEIGSELGSVVTFALSGTGTKTVYRGTHIGTLRRTGGPASLPVPDALLLDENGDRVDYMRIIAYLRGADATGDVSITLRQGASTDTDLEDAFEGGSHITAWQSPKLHASDTYTVRKGTTTGLVNPNRLDIFAFASVYDRLET